MKITTTKTVGGDCFDPHEDSISITVEDTNGEVLWSIEDVGNCGDCPEDVTLARKLEPLLRLPELLEKVCRESRRDRPTFEMTNLYVYCEDE